MSRLTVLWRQYAAVLGTPSARRFTVAAFVGRLPTTMFALVLTALLRSFGWNYAEIGAVIAASALCTAVASPVLGRLADSRGQRPVALASVSVYTVGLLTIVLIGSALPYVAVLVIAAASGAANPPLAVLVRGRWSNHLVRRENLTRAFAWETALEGVGWVIGPLLGSGLISFLGPRPTVACALLFTVAGTIWFALLDSAPRGRGAGPTSRGRLPLPSREVRHRILSFVAIGGMLGSVDLGLVAYGLAWNRNLAGVFLTAFAVGGAVGSLTAGAATSHVSTVRRLRLAGLCTVVSMIALILASTPLTVAGAATLGGASLTPFMSLTYAALGEAVSEQLVSEAVGWAAGGVGLGISGGTVVAGWILDGNARSAVFGFAAALGVLVLVLGYLSTRRQRAELGS